MQIKAVKQQMRLVPHSLTQAVTLSLLKVMLQDGLVQRMRALVDYKPRPLPGAQPPHVRQTLLRDNDIEVVLRLVHVRAHRNDARHAVRVRLGRPC